MNRQDLILSKLLRSHMNHSVNIDYNLDKTSSIRILHIGGNKSTYITAISNVRQHSHPNPGRRISTWPSQLSPTVGGAQWRGNCRRDS